MRLNLSGFARLGVVWGLFGISILGASAPAMAEKPSLKEYWQHTDMNFSFMLTNIIRTCRGNRLIACVEALNEGAAFMDPPAVFATHEEGMAGSPVTSKFIENMGPIGLYELALPDPKLTYADYVKRDQKIRAIRLQALQRLASSGTALDFRSILAQISDRMLAKGKDYEPLIAGAMSNAYLAAAYDPHTHVDPAQMDEDEESNADDNFVGIGVSLGKVSSHYVVEDLIDGSPALAAGVRAKDEIVAIDGQAVDSLTFSDLVSKIRGPENSQVKLEVRRKGALLTITVTRGKVTSPNVLSKIVDHAGYKAGYIRFSSFMDEKGCTSIGQAVRTLTRKGAQSLILDLRHNGGGLLDQAVCIGALFVGKKPIVQIRKMDGTLQQVLDGQEDAVTDLPMVTLIDGRSASASEILAGALQDYQRSLIMGDRSFGKATVQQLFTLTATLIAAQTTSRFYQPSGRTNQVVGILPNIALDPFPGATEDDKIMPREADLYTNALPPMSQPWVEPRPQYIAKLKACMSSGNLAAKLYQQHQDDAMAPDYQLFAAEEALACELAGNSSVRP